MTPQVKIYTDGACSGNPGPGGWGVVLEHASGRKELHGGEAATTNNRMELMAAIRALEALTKPCRVELHTDSQYVRQGITIWIHGWKARGWRTADKSPVKNEDLWRALDSARSRHEVDWRWVKGHAGDPGNERADALARLGCEEAKAQSGATRKRAPEATPTTLTRVPAAKAAPASASAAHSVPSTNTRPSPRRKSRATSPERPTKRVT